MAFGFLSITDAGGTQIDETTPCLVLKQKGTVQVTGGSNNSAYMVYNLSYTGSVPLLALSCDKQTNAAVACIGASSSGNSWSFAIGIDNSNFGPGTGGTYIFTYYIFDRPTLGLGADMGLVVLDSGSSLVYSSREQPLKVETRTGTWNGTEEIIDTSRTYAIAQVSGVEYREQEHEIDASSSSTGLPAYFWTWEAQLQMIYTVQGGYRSWLKSVAGGDGFAPDDPYGPNQLGGNFGAGASIAPLVIDVTGM